MKNAFLFILFLPLVLFAQNSYDSIASCVTDHRKINIIGEHHMMMENFYIENAILQKCLDRKNEIIIFYESPPSEMYIFLSYVKSKDSVAISNYHAWPVQKRILLNYYNLILKGHQLTFVPLDIEDDISFSAYALEKLTREYSNIPIIQELRLELELLRNVKVKRAEPIIEKTIQLSRKILSDGSLNVFDSTWLNNIINSMALSKSIVMLSAKKQTPFREVILVANFKSAIDKYYNPSLNRMIYGFWGWAHVNGGRTFKKQNWISLAGCLKRDSSFCSKINTVGIVYHSDREIYQKNLAKIIQEKEVVSYILNNREEYRCVDFLYKSYFDKIVYTKY